MGKTEKASFDSSEAQNIKKKQLLGELRKILPVQRILYSESEMRPYECDGLSVYTNLPLAVAIPDTLKELKSILAVCRKYDVPVVCRGAGTGLSGGALPLSNGLLISMARFNQILEIDPENRTARLQPGVRNLTVSQAAAQYNLYYAPDPSSQIACTIGGNIAENAGGVHCLKYGLTVNNLLQVKVLTMEGEIITAGGTGFDSPGYDLRALFTGSEGMLGIIVEALVKLLPVPESARVLLASFDDIKQAGDAVAEIIASGILPAGLEMMDELAVQAAEEFAHPNYPSDAKAVILCEVDGCEEETASDIEKAKQIFLRSGAKNVRLAADEEERTRMWAGRKGAFPAVGRISPDYYCMDGTIPRKKLGSMLESISEMSGRYGLRVANVFHAGDGNLHPLILYDSNSPDELKKAERFGADILELSVALGGSVSGEHGVGMEKLDQMCYQFANPELETFHEIKKALDPPGLLNPGKAVPLLSRCSELGGMHVHEGNLPHPDLERF
ncbi:MAG: FAD-binding protein [Spirochaetia bacterium]|nr:FAD-binding protein [Spirochaetia bacterium]